jgi:hypothetical protein
MFGMKRILAVGAIVAFALMPGCNSKIDSANGPDVVFEVDNPLIPTVEGTRDPVTLVCTFKVTVATASFKNKPKNSLAGTSPFNDILLESVTVTYVWDDVNIPGGGGVSGPTVFGLGGSVPANGTSTAQFSVVNAGDIAGRDGHSAALGMTFRGHTVAGDAVEAEIGGNLIVNTCQ